MIDPDHQLSLITQCKLLGLNRRRYYNRIPTCTAVNTATAYNLELMQLIDEEYMRHPFYGTRQMTAYLNRLGHCVNRKRIQRLRRLMGLQSLAPKPYTSQRRKGPKIYPYWLRGLDITRINPVVEH